MFYFETDAIRCIFVCAYQKVLQTRRATGTFTGPCPSGFASRLSK